MGRLILVPWGQTAWSATGRMTGRTPLPLTEGGRHDVYGWADQLARLGVATIYASEEATSEEVAAILVSRTGAAHKTEGAFAELDVGLWDGLTQTELRLRYPKAFKKWSNDPTSACPPGGEDGMQVFERIAEVLERILRKNRQRCFAIVLGPVTLALARCWLESLDAGHVRSLLAEQPLVYELDEDGIASAAAPIAQYLDRLQVGAMAEPAE